MGKSVQERVKQKIGILEKLVEKMKEKKIEAAAAFSKLRNDEGTRILKQALRTSIRRRAFANIIYDDNKEPLIDFEDSRRLFSSLSSIQSTECGLREEIEQRLRSFNALPNPNAASDTFLLVDEVHPSASIVESQMAGGPSQKDSDDDVYSAAEQMEDKDLEEVEAAAQEFDESDDEDGFKDDDDDALEEVSQTQHHFILNLHTQPFNPIPVLPNASSSQEKPPVHVVPVHVNIEDVSHDDDAEENEVALPLAALQAITRYERALNQLEFLRFEITPGTKPHVSALIAHVKAAKNAGKVMDDLVEALEKTHSLLSGGNEAISLGDYNQFANTMEGHPSTPKKILGGIMLGLGAAVAAAILGIFLTAALFSTGLGLMIAAIPVVVGLGAGIGFFASSKRMGVSKILHNIAEEEGLQQAISMH